MAYNIIWKNPDETIKVTTLVSDATLEDVINFKNILVGRGETSIFQAIVQSDQLPQERYFRNAWRFDGNNITLDIAACKQRHLEKLRRVRNSKLQDSDPDYMRAVEQGDQTKLDALKTYRQALRNMPQTSATDFANAATPEAVRSLRPAILDTLKP